jgi:hypothetical protein
LTSCCTTVSSIQLVEGYQASNYSIYSPYSNIKPLIVIVVNSIVPHQTIMVITLINSYPKLNEEGKRKLDSKGEPITVFKYRVKGKPEDLEKYEEIMTAGKHTCKDSIGLLWFTTQPVGEKGKLCISTNGKIYADTTANDLASSLIKQYPGQLGLMLAKDVLLKGFVSTEETEQPQEQPSGKGIDDLD